MKSSKILLCWKFSPDIRSRNSVIFNLMSISSLKWLNCNLSSFLAIFSNSLISMISVVSSSIYSSLFPFSSSSSSNESVSLSVWAFSRNSTIVRCFSNFNLFSSINSLFSSTKALTLLRWISFISFLKGINKMQRALQKSSSLSWLR